MINPKKLTTISEYEVRNLSNVEMEKLLQAFFSLASSKNYGKNIIYRGVSYNFLSDRLSKENEEIDDIEISRRLFYFGEKAQHFRNESIDRTWLEDISDISSKTSNKIFDRLSNLQKSNNVDIKRFVASNSNFFAFFADKNNKNAFSEIIHKLGVIARDYYWSILHTAGYIGTRGKSISVSTSRSLKQAIGFSGNHGERRYVIIAINRTNYEKRKKLLQHISSHGIPVLKANVSIYHTQQEETIKAGLLPHDIVGLYCIHERMLIVNPHMFSDENKNINIATKPLKINQEHFEEWIRRCTNYSSWFYTFDCETYHEQ